MTTVYDWAVAALHGQVDGDTLDMTVEGESPGFGIGGTRYRARFRVTGPGGRWFDAWERGDTLGPQASLLATAWVEEAYDAGQLRATTYKPRGILPDGQFGRWLADLYRTDTDEHLADYLTARGAAKTTTT